MLVIISSFSPSVSLVVGFGCSNLAIFPVVSKGKKKTVSVTSSSSSRLHRSTFELQAILQRIAMTIDPVKALVIKQNIFFSFFQMNCPLKIEVDTKN